jgi:hypothetical protein
MPAARTCIAVLRECDCGAEGDREAWRLARVSGGRVRVVVVEPVDSHAGHHGGRAHEFAIEERLRQAEIDSCVVELLQVVSPDLDVLAMRCCCC